MYLLAFRAQDKAKMEFPLDMVSFFSSICLAIGGLPPPFPMIESLSKTTKYEDEGILANFCRLHVILRMHILSWTSLVVAQRVFPCVAVYEY